MKGKEMSQDMFMRKVLHTDAVIRRMASNLQDTANSKLTALEKRLKRDFSVNGYEYLAIRKTVAYKKLSRQLTKEGIR
jgi:hypothetical protein